jgi:hypothetical protein
LKQTARQAVAAESRRNRLRAGTTNQTWVRRAINRLPPAEVERGLHEPAGLELIWNYFLEEAGLVQGFMEVCRRFQNKRSALARFDISPLRRIGDFIDGYIDDVEYRGKIQQRSLEYTHQYGLQLVGRAIGNVEPADARSRFLQAFHGLLHACMRFYEDVDDLQVVEDARAILNALKDVHLLLAEGSHNLYSELPAKARIEFRVIQFILGQNALREFLGGRIMVTYPEPWMPHLARLREILRWGDRSVADYYHLANIGEQLLLRIRFGPFAPNTPITPGQTQLARQFALAFRDSISQYVFSYHALTGVDLVAKARRTVSLDATPPSTYFRALHQRSRAD